jgi:poly-gamma-glutamate capsule biosynthesis protein CapA/YwtB (metallophosphatase superfamily)
VTKIESSEIDPKSSEHHHCSSDRGLAVAIGGDLLGPYHPVLHLKNASFQRLLDVLLSTDVGFANQEGSIFDGSSFSGCPSAENNGLPLSEGSVARELRMMGITIVSKANNHAVDWGLEGLTLSEATLKDGGVRCVGSGEDEATARAPVYLRTPNGRVAVIATASTFQLMARAADAGSSGRGPTRARPGISVLRLTSAMRVSPPEMRTLKAIAEKRGVPISGTKLDLAGRYFTQASKHGYSYTIDTSDETAILQATREAAETSKAVILSVHAHETDNGEPDDPIPPDFLVRLAHEAIDHGATTFVRTGPHALCGVEIYKGCPIFFGMGSLFFDFGGKRSYTVPGTGRTINFPEEWFESILATVSYRDHAPVEVRLHPVLLNGSAGPDSGLPLLATGADADRILDRLARLSFPFRTVIERVDGIGVINLPAERRGTSG